MSLDEQLKTFLKNTANSVLKLEILSYYHDRRFALDNVEGLAKWLNRRVEDVSADMEDLLRAGLFSREAGDQSAVCVFSPDEQTAGLVERAVSAYRLTREAVDAEVLSLEKKQEDLRREFQRLLFTERGKTETILNSLEEAVLVLNGREMVLLANRQFLERFGVSRDSETAGLGLDELAGRTSGLAGAVRASLGRMGQAEQETDFSNARCYYKLQSLPVAGPDGRVIAAEDGRPAATVTIFRDVTRERELQQLREDFISMLTHDLKNPLSIIFGSSTLVLDGKLGLLNEKQNRLLSNVVKSCGLMNRLIEDFLTLSRLEAGQLNLSLEPVELRELIANVLQLFNPQIAERKLRTGFDPASRVMPVLADPMQLERVVSNLIGNAIKYNREGGSLEVGLSDEGASVRVDISDTGEGIAEDELPFIFEKFRRATSAKTIKGTGLGLTIARQLVTAMGGEIWAVSRPGEGSCFSFRLPSAGKLNEVPVV